MTNVSIEKQADAMPLRKPFFTPRHRVRVAPEVAARQGQAVRVATDALVNRAAVLFFLNTHDERLGGRPIDLAVANDAGLAAVKARLAQFRLMDEAMLSENPDRVHAVARPPQS